MRLLVWQNYTNTLRCYRVCYFVEHYVNTVCIACMFDVGEMSVATSVAAVDETSLLDMPDETLHSTRLVQWVHDSNPPAQFTSGNHHDHVAGN